MIMFSLVFLYYHLVKIKDPINSYIVYFSIYIFDFICILISSIKLTRIIYKKRNEAYEEHKLIIAFFALLICCSIITRLAFSYGILEFDWPSIMIYSIVELVILLIFSIFKKDEDCFACFNRSN